MTPHFLSRRELLHRCGMGIGSLALMPLLADDGVAASSANPLLPKAPHFEPRAKHVVHLFMAGGPSHVDTFDPKPSLTRYAGKKLPTANLETERATGAAYPSPFRFQKFGESGIEVSELFSKTAEFIDDIAVVRSMYADVPNHEPSFLLMNCGEARLPRPSMGSWITYGLGTENQNLPGFISLCPGGLPTQGAENWRSAFLPGIYQGTYINSQHNEIEKLIEHIRHPSLDLKRQRKQLDLLLELNAQHRAERGADPQLDARIESYELAFRMQTEAAEAFDISREPKHIHELYGDNQWGRQMLLTRRLIERGVRFVQVWPGAGQPWDNHDNIMLHGHLAGQCDGPIAAFLTDLKQRGLFDETLVVWGGEFGRTPTVELPRPLLNTSTYKGRDHNHWGFSMWLAGGGIKGGQTYGATDEFGWKAIEKRMHVHDLHATMLHLLGFDHERFTYRHAGRDFRLTDVHGYVVHELIA